MEFICGLIIGASFTVFCVSSCLHHKYSITDSSTQMSRQFNNLEECQIFASNNHLKCKENK
jgi:hypothetical protein